MLRIAAATMFLLLFGASIGATRSNESVIDDFSTARIKGKVVISNGRYWYAFGGLSLGLDDGMTARGATKTWSGFGVDPGTKGKNGKIIQTTNFTVLHVALAGRAPRMKIELYDEKYVRYEYWLNPGVEMHSITLDRKLVNMPIAKIQFVFAPGTIDVRIASISLR